MKCDQEAVIQFKNGKYCCSISWNKCKNIRLKNSLEKLKEDIYAIT